jgi:hypothetical protein
LQRKADQEEQRRLCGNCYVTEHIGFIMVNELGELMKLNHLSRGFPDILKKYKLRLIRFHDLRHPYVKPTPKKILLRQCPLTIAI